MSSLHKIAWMTGVVAVALGLYVVIARQNDAGFVAVAVGLITIFLANKTSRSGKKKD